MKNLSSKHLGLIVIGLLILGIWAIVGSGKSDKRTTMPSPKNSSSDRVAGARTQVEAAMRETVSGDDEAQRLFAFFMAKGSIGLFIGRDFKTEKGVAPELVQGNAPLDQRRFLLIPVSPSERLLRGLPNTANFFFDARTNMVYTPSPKTFTKYWFGARAIHEVSHVYDYLQGIEPAPGKDITEVFVNGEVRAHELEIRVLNLRVNGQLIPRMKQVATKLGAPPGFPKNEIVEESVDFNEIDSLFLRPLSDEENNSRRGSYLVAINFAMAEIAGLGEKGKLVYLTEHLKRQDRESP